MIATRTSPWYVTSAGTGLLVLLMSGVSSTQQFQLSFHDRILETVIGATAAIVFGVVIPRLLGTEGPHARTEFGDSSRLSRALDPLAADRVRQAMGHDRGQDHERGDLEDLRAVVHG